MWSALSQGFSAVREICNIYAFPVVSVELSFDKFTWHAKTRVSHRHDSRLNKDDQFAFLFAVRPCLVISTCMVSKTVTSRSAVSNRIGHPHYLIVSKVVSCCAQLPSSWYKLTKSVWPEIWKKRDNRYLHD